MLSIPEQLRLLQKISRYSQEKLATELGVSFVTFNSWINGRSQPRASARQKIHALYQEYSGEKSIPKNELNAKKNIIWHKSHSHTNILKKIRETPDISEQFMLSLTYHTNSIEGSTLTEPETAVLLFHDVSLPDKSMREQLEVKNHQTAWQYLLNYIAQKSSPIDEDLILKLHSILMNGLQEDAGFYRRHGVRIIGANIPTANYIKVPKLMQEISQKIPHKTHDTIAHISQIHAQFEQIHPFSDGNGRIGRLLIHAMAFQHNLPPALILQEKKHLYYSSLQKAQRTGDQSLLEDFLCDGFLESFQILEDS